MSRAPRARTTSGPLPSGVLVEADALLHGERRDAFGDAGCQGADQRPDANEGVEWHVAMRPGRRRARSKTRPMHTLVDEIDRLNDRLKAGVRAKVQPPLRVVRRPFGHVKVRYRGLMENTAQWVTPFALSDPSMARRAWLALDGQVRPAAANAP